MQERYAYDPFGKATVYDASYVVRTGGSAYAQMVLFQGLRQDPLTGYYEADLRWYSPTLVRPAPEGSAWAPIWNRPRSWSLVEPDA